MFHFIKGAERAHKLLIRLGENPVRAKEIALAILFHTDSFLPTDIKRKPLQQIVKWADERDEEEGGNHHYRKLNLERAIKSVSRLDKMVDLQIEYLKQQSKRA